MSREGIVKKYLDLCGEELTPTFSNGIKGEPFIAVLEPIAYKNKTYLEGTPTDIGISASGFYTLYTAAENAEILMEDGVILVGESVSCYMQRCEIIHFNNEIIFARAVVKECG